MLLEAEALIFTNEELAWLSRILRISLVGGESQVDCNERVAMIFDKALLGGVGFGVGAGALGADGDAGGAAKEGCGTATLATIVVVAFGGMLCRCRWRSFLKLPFEPIDELQLLPSEVLL